MAKIAPFSALRYDTAKIKDLGKVTAPPYDIISPRDQDLYYGLHPNNIVRLDFGKTQAGDNESTNKYSRAATQLRLWKEQGLLKTDLKPGFYVLSQDFQTPDGKKLRFAGVYAQLKLEDYKTRVVRPHEKTLSKPKSDRFDLTQATATNFSPIFLLFDDKKQAATRWMAAQMKQKPLLDFKSLSGERHRLWAVTAKAATGAFARQLAKVPVYIADGHHRYETMLKYARETKGKARAAAASTLVCLAPFQSKGMVILPTHRLLVDRKGFSAAALVSCLQQHFDVAEHKDLKAVEKAMAAATQGKKPRTVFGLVLKSALPYYTLSLKAGLKPDKAVAGKRSPAYKSLDVALLQALVLEGCLGMTPESIAAQENLVFEKSAERSAKMVLESGAQAAFLLNPTRMEQLQAVSDAKDVMPQKSTYFLPKLLTGMVLRSIS